MSSGDLAAVVVTVCVLVALVALIVVLTSALALMRDLRAKLEEFDERASPALGQLAETAQMASTEIGRLRELLNVAERVTGLAETAGAATVRAAAVPVDKLRSAISVLRSRGDDAPGD